MDLPEEFLDDICEIRTALMRIAEHLERNVHPSDTLSTRDFVGAICETIREGFDKVCKEIRCH